MKGLVKEGRRPYAYQKAIPERFRHLFGGSKKFSVSLDTHEHDEAVRRATVAARDFDHRCGMVEAPPVNLPAIAGVLFEKVLNRSEFVTCREAVEAEVAVLQDAGHPFVHGLPIGGPTMDKLVAMLDQMCGDVELRGAPQWSGFKGQNRVSKTIDEHAAAWHQKPSPLAAKTLDQYLKDARDFASWYRSALRRPAVGAAITKKDVNAYVESRMKVGEPKATIKRRLAGLTKIYKSGQFIDDNPFARVTDRIDVHGPELTVRPFTDQEVRHLFRESLEWDIKVQLATRIAAYSGMRLGEICSLKITDVQHVQIGKEKVYYFNLQKQGGRKLKTEASYRFVPVHPSYRDDLLSFIKGREGYLLDEPVDKYGNRAGAISKRMGRLIDCVAPDPEAREHSFRHTVISKLSDAGVREELRKALVGHTGGDPHDGYNHSMRIRELSNAVRLIDYSA